MRFANPHIFWLIAVVVALIAIFIYGVYIQRRKLHRFGNIQLLSTLMPNVSYIRPQVKFYMLVVALLFAVFFKYKHNNMK